MSFPEVVQTVLTQKYADFSGRARRSEYWFFYLFTILVFLVVVVLGALLGTTALVVLYLLAIAGLIVPSLALTVRRLHDTDRSGWWFLIVFVPFVGGIVLLVWAVTDGTPGPNQYGPSPKEPAGYDGGYGANPNAPTWN